MENVIKSSQSTPVVDTKVEISVASRVKMLSSRAFSAQPTNENQHKKPGPVKTRRSTLVETRMKWLSGENIVANNEGIETDGNNKENAAGKLLLKNRLKSAVQRHKEGIESKEKELKRYADPKSFQKASWKLSGHTKYKRKISDMRGVAPKKTLEELP
mmetsp:Transcript_8211/g.11848  ORF Transcript_8211/g.11848 Transcript_8211/m.11848 type:complete len:158 (-) Transcript_8211:1330-1803(-)